MAEMMEKPQNRPRVPPTLEMVSTGVIAAVRVSLDITWFFRLTTIVWRDFFISGCTVLKSKPNRA